MNYKFLNAGSAMGTSEINAKRLYGEYVKLNPVQPMDFQTWLDHYRIEVTS